MKLGAFLSRLAGELLMLLTVLVSIGSPYAMLYISQPPSVRQWLLAVIYLTLAPVSFGIGLMMHRLDRPRRATLTRGAAIGCLLAAGGTAAVWSVAAISGCLEYPGFVGGCANAPPLIAVVIATVFGVGGVVAWHLSKARPNEPSA